MKNLLLSFPKYGIRKYPIGICSVVIGLSFLGAQPVLAQEGGETGPIEVSVKEHLFRKPMKEVRAVLS